MRLIMEYQVIEEIRKLFQTLIAPQLEGIKGDIRALDAKFDAKFETVGIKIDGVDSKVESCRGVNCSPRFVEWKRYFPQILYALKKRSACVWEV